jgi:hypothetical protein
MDKYNLYLDESQPMHILPFFCLAGCIIEEGEEYKNLSAKLNELKLNVFGDSSKSLHEQDVRNAVKGFEILKQREKREVFWSGFRKIFSDTQFWIISSAINSIEYGKLYTSCMANDTYHVTLQIVMENFVYFLVKNNATGMIYLEKTTDAESDRLRNHYHNILSTGTLYLSPTELQKRLSNINFLTKNDNNAGLQMADFIPNALNRMCTGLKPKKPSLVDIIENKFYDGGHGLCERFGKRILLCNNP